MHRTIEVIYGRRRDQRQPLRFDYPTDNARIRQRFFTEFPGDAEDIRITTVTIYGTGAMTADDVHQALLATLNTSVTAPHQHQRPQR